MMKLLRRNLVVIVPLVALLVLCVFTATALAKPAPAKNVIILIADGSGFNTRLATDYYEYGAAGMQAYEDWPVSLAVSTYPYQPEGEDRLRPGFGVDRLQLRARPLGCAGGDGV